MNEKLQALSLLWLLNFNMIQYCTSKNNIYFTARTNLSAIQLIPSNHFSHPCKSSTQLSSAVLLNLDVQY